MRIGIDLDNTLINYDRPFYQIALARGLIPCDFVGTKRDIRDYVRLLPDGDGEIQWQHLQAEAYGPAIGSATAAQGALEFIRRARASGAELSIVSHKTTFSNLGTQKVNLREAARTWLLDNGLLGPDVVPQGNLYFEDTRAEKIARIIALGCTHFIDDLEEVFDDPAFPSTIQQLHFTSAASVPGSRYRSYASFNEIADVLITA
jgi:hypothetical protein